MVNFVINSLKEFPPIILSTIHFNHPVLTSITYWHIIPVPTALEGRIYREERLVAGIHSCPNKEVVRKQQNVTSQHFGYNVLATIKQSVNTLLILDFQSFKFFFEQFLHVRISLDRIFRESFIATIEQLEEVSENLGAVASVNLFYNQEFVHRLFALLYVTILLPCRNVCL